LLRLKKNLVLIQWDIDYYRRNQNRLGMCKPHTEGRTAKGAKRNAKGIFLTFALVVLITAFGLTLPSSLGNTSTTWTVHPTDPSANFNTIQDAIANASEGDSIEVWNGTYNESAVVHKRLVIYSRDGADATIVQAANSSDNVFNITANYVNITGFTIKGATGYQKAGVSLYSSHNTITDNNASFNYYGIALFNSSKNVISNNTANNNIVGLLFYPTGGGNFNTITNNNFDRNNDGINVLGFLGPNTSNDNTIINNSATFNAYAGMNIYDSRNNTVERNNFSYSQLSSGIQIWENSSNNTINKNVANSNGQFGIRLMGLSNNNTVTNNIASFNKHSGISLTDSTSRNNITNNVAWFNTVSGIALYRSSNNNQVANNDLFSNLIGMSFLGSDIMDNQISNNTVSCSKSHGIWLLDLRHPNNVTNNNASNNLFGILLANSTNISINYNNATLNERGIVLGGSSEVQVTDNLANWNIISGISLLNSINNTLHNNTAHNNTYEGIYLSNSSLNDISRNTISSSYFGISLYSSNNNTITENVGESIYYYNIFNYSSTGNTIGNFAQEDIHNQTDIIRAVRLYVLESRTSSLQSVTPSTNATYDIVVENLGNMPDTFDLNISSSDNPDVLHLDTNDVTLGPGEISARIVANELETIKLNVSDNEPGIYRATVAAISRNDNTVNDVVETWTIVQGEVDSPPINSVIMNSALINSTISDSTINRSAIINCTISGSTITASILTNSEVVGTPLNNVILEDAIVNNGYIVSGAITINGIDYEITNEIQISDLVIGSDYRDSDLVGIQYAKTLNVYAENSNVSLNISARDDYFAGSMCVQKSIITPNGIPEDTNNVGGYVYANVSDNLVNSTGWLIIKVFYDETQLEDLDENSLTLRYFDVSANRWEDIPIGGRNPEENYVWGNISHYSVFSVSGSVTPKGVPPGVPSMPGGGSSAPLDSDDDGLTNIQELIIGTDPDNPDTDGDGLKDGEDPFPLNPNLPVRLTPTPSPVLPPGVSMIPIDPTGLVTSSVTVDSADGKASVTIPAGTIAKDATGNPLTEVTITLPSALPAGVPSGVEYVGYAIQVGPGGARFSQPVEIFITFDPAQFEGKKPVIYVYEAGAWMPLETTVVGNKATAKVDHFSIFVLFAEKAAPTPTLSPTPPPVLAVPPVIPLYVILIAIVVALIIIAGALVLRRR
jgi:parallel beta-helix repeat protein